MLPEMVSEARALSAAPCWLMPGKAQALTVQHEVLALQANESSPGAAPGILTGLNLLERCLASLSEKHSKVF